MYYDTTVTLNRGDAFLGDGGPFAVMHTLSRTLRHMPVCCEQVGYRVRSLLGGGELSIKQALTQSGVICNRPKVGDCIFVPVKDPVRYRPRAVCLIVVSRDDELTRKRLRRAWDYARTGHAEYDRDHRYNVLRDCMKSVRRHLKDAKISKLQAAVTSFGCGPQVMNGGLAWDNVMPILEDVFEGSGVSVAAKLGPKAFSRRKKRRSGTECEPPVCKRKRRTSHKDNEDGYDIDAYHNSLFIDPLTEDLDQLLLQQTQEEQDVVMFDDNEDDVLDLLADDVDTDFMNDLAEEEKQQQQQCAAEEKDIRLSLFSWAT
ncbi:hypothetical protein RRG08_061485 [Elysia crispata]|uniref:Macro domain-containing protein n=1 Tax=Elysia crispata TaxID=231223 RepID=A0AAE1CXD0_9GAST|nr:hypothetical protein RRG08_061485 [Elysia crispata]